MANNHISDADLISDIISQIDFMADMICAAQPDELVMSESGLRGLFNMLRQISADLEKIEDGMTV